MTENGSRFNLEEWAAQYERRTHTLQSDTSATSSPSFALVSETSSRSIMNDTCLNRHGRHSGSFAFDKIEPSLRDSDAENGQELNGTLNLPTGQSITWTLVRRSWILFTTLVTLALALVLACKRLPAVNSDLSFSQSDHCYEQRPVDFMNGLSLPYQINIVLHEAILNELGDSETLERLVLTRSKLYSSLENKDRISRFACAIKEYSSKQVAPVFLDQITITKAQLDLIVHEVSELLDIYRLLGPAYYEHESATAKAVQEVQLSNLHHFAIRVQPWFFQKIGLDAKKAYWDPWIEKSKKWKEAQSGTIALNGETQRLERIAQVAQKVLQQLEQLWQLVQETTVRKGRKEKAVKSHESTRQWYKQWFRQNIVQQIRQDVETLTDSEFNSWWESLCCGPEA